MIQYRTTFDYTPSGPAPGVNEGEVQVPDDAAPAGFRGLEWELVATCASVKHIFYTWKRKLIVWTPSVEWKRMHGEEVMSDYPKTPQTHREAVQTLVDFIGTAPGRLPERVEVALAIVARNYLVLSSGDTSPVAELVRAAVALRRGIPEQEVTATSERIIAITDAVNADPAVRAWAERSKT